MGSPELQIELEAGAYWIFPPALNLTFASAYMHAPTARNDTGRGVPGLISDAVSNLTLADRFDDSDANRGFGGSDAQAVLRVGDALEVDWKGSGNHSLSLNCVVCTAGPESGPVENACNNYTRLANSYDKYNTSQSLAPRSTYIIPSLEGYFPLEDANKNRTCALCIANLLENGFTTANWTVPFPVLVQSAYPHKRFSAEHPTGIEDVNISVETSTSLPAPDTQGDTSSINVGMVVGVVVGVLAATVMCALLYWWMWKKRRSRAKPVDSGASSTLGQEASPQSVALQRIQGVVRRPDTSTSEVPPPYHEAVRNGNTP